MANQTLTTGTPSARVNYDSATLAGLANGETITINGGHLLIDGDVRWGNNAAIFDSITISTTLGGSVLIDGTKVWEVPFSVSTGIVPAAAVVGSNPVTGTGVTGELLSVFATGALAPSAAAAAMPTAGFIKLRSKTGDFSNGLVVTLPGGATVTCSGAGKRSWVHAVAEELGTVTVPRLGEFTIQGDWYELGETNGSDDQTFQFPIADNCPAIQVETAPGSGIYEWYLNAGSRWGTATIYVPQDARGKYFGQVNSTGVITIAQRASNACGFKPAAGCKVRIGNVICSNTNSTNYALNTINATLATRYDFTTTAAGIVNIDKASVNWYLSLTNAFEASVTHTAILHAFALSNIASTMLMDDVAVGLDGTLDATSSFANCFTQTILNKVRIACYSARSANQSAVTITDCSTLSVVDCQVEMFGSLTATTRGSASVRCIYATRLFSSVFTRLTLIGAGVASASCDNMTFTDVTYADTLNGTTTTTFPLAAVFNNTPAVTNFTLDGFSSFAGLANVHPYAILVQISGGCSDSKVVNIGSPSTPYNCGSANALGILVAAYTSVNLVLRRIYAQNVRTSPLTLANNVQGIVCDNVWGDAADSQAIAGINITARGCRWTNSVIGQSSVYGRHWEDAFTSTTAGRILIACNEPLADTANQCEITAGSAAFTSTGQVAMTQVGDEVVWNSPYFVLGITSLANINPTITGTGATFVSGNNWTNFYLDFQYDTGSGFNGTWLPLNGATLSGVGAIDPSTGVRLKVRAQTKTASTTNALTYIRIDSVTNSVAQQTQYPLPSSRLTVTGFENGSDIVIYDASIEADGTGSNVLESADAISGSFIYEYVGTPTIKVGVFKPGFVPQISPQILLTAGDSSYLAQQRNDRNYS